MSDQSDDDSARNLAPDILTSAFVAGVSLSGPEQAFIASVQAPILMHMARRAAEELSPRLRTLRAGRALSAACEAARMTPRQLERRISSSTTNVDLADAALSGAATAAYEARIVALGRALAAGLLAEDEAVMDVERLVIQAVSDLEASHVRLLNLACVSAYYPTSFEALVAQEAPKLAPHLGVLLATLTRRHLLEVEVVNHYDRTAVRRWESGGGVSFGPERLPSERRTSATTFGKLVHERLLEAGMSREAD